MCAVTRVTHHPVARLLQTGEQVLQQQSMYKHHPPPPAYLELVPERVELGLHPPVRR
jgi:hypothetical protein